MPELRASTFHPPTLDMLDQLGVTSHLISQGLITPKIQYRDLDDGLVAEFDHDLIKDRTSHPYRLQCEQFKLTRVIAKMLEEYPHAEIRFQSGAGFFDRVRLAEAVQHDRAAFRRQRPGVAEAQTACRAGDQRRPSVEKSWRILSSPL